MNTAQSPAASSDGFAAIATIAALRGVTTDQMALLDIITNPANEHGEAFTSREEVLTDFDDEWGGFMGDDAYYNARTIAHRLDVHYTRLDEAAGVTDGAGRLEFAFVCGIDGETHEFTVGVYLGSAIGAYLTKGLETKRLTSDRSATGLQAALGYAQSINFYSSHLRDAAVAKGLMSPISSG